MFTDGKVNTRTREEDSRDGTALVGPVDGYGYGNVAVGDLSDLAGVRASNRDIKRLVESAHRAPQTASIMAMASWVCRTSCR